MKKALLLTLAFLFLVVGALNATLTETGRYEGYFNVDHGDGSVIITPYSPPTCVEDWSSSSYTTCINNQHSLICVDKNHCGTYTTMPTNCGNVESCEVSSSSSSGGSSSSSHRGSSSSSIECSEDWNCTTWSKCVDGIQSRTCKDLNECNTNHLKPITQRSCELKESITVNGLNQNKNNGIFSWITGAVIGTLGTVGTIVAIAFVIGIIGAAVAVRIVRKNSWARP
jgi:hypothetical protein